VFFVQAEDGIRDRNVTGVQTCALPILEHVTVLEFGEELRADSVLQDRLHRLPNVTVIKQAQTTEITGTDVVNGISYIERATEEEKHIELEGVFVQIGLVPNTAWLGDLVERNKMG